jgi:hypothetical protein
MVVSMEPGVPDQPLGETDGEPRQVQEVLGAEVAAEVEPGAAVQGYPRGPAPGPWQLQRGQG